MKIAINELSLECTKEMLLHVPIGDLRGLARLLKVPFTDKTKKAALVASLAESGGLSARCEFCVGIRSDKDDQFRAEPKLVLNEFRQQRVNQDWRNSVEVDTSDVVKRSLRSAEEVDVPLPTSQALLDSITAVVGHR